MQPHLLRDHECNFLSHLEDPILWSSLLQLLTTLPLFLLWSSLSFRGRACASQLSSKSREWLTKPLPAETLQALNGCQKKGKLVFLGSGALPGCSYFTSQPLSHVQVCSTNWVQLSSEQQEVERGGWCEESKKLGVREWGWLNKNKMYSCIKEKHVC